MLCYNACDSFGNTFARAVQYHRCSLISPKSLQELQHLMVSLRISGWNALGGEASTRSGRRSGLVTSHSPHAASLRAAIRCEKPDTWLFWASDIVVLYSVCVCVCVHVCGSCISVRCVRAALLVEAQFTSQ